LVPAAEQPPAAAEEAKVAGTAEPAVLTPDK